MQKQEQTEVYQWLHRNARELELTLWDYHFGSGTRAAVIEAMLFYRNEDGGYGHALEPDSWNPNSSPYTTLHAGNLLKSIGAEEEASELMKEILNYFNQTTHYSQEWGWDFSIPSNDDFPHAVWWTFNEEMNRNENPGLTADISAFILEFSVENSEIHQKAIYHAKRLLPEFLTKENFGELEIMGIHRLTKLVATHPEFSEELITNIQKKIAFVVNNVIEKDTEKWKEYHPRPSAFISSANDDFYAAQKELLEVELDYLIDTRAKGGVWAIPWNWMQEDEANQKAFTISENANKGLITINQMNLLKEFGRLETE